MDVPSGIQKDREGWVGGQGGGGVILTSCEVRYGKDVVMLMILLRRRCSCLSDVVTLMTLLRRR